MLKFTIVFLHYSCYFCQVWNAPVIKASGVQWTEPKGNGKGNLTLIMIPQNNSCTNDTDMLIAVKSDFQVVSQDTQLLNLVINEYQNNTQNESNETWTKEINSSIPDIRENQDCKVNQTDGGLNANNTTNKLLYSPNINKNNMDGLNKSTCSYNNIQYEQSNPNRYPLQNSIANEIALKTDDNPKSTRVLNTLICTEHENQMKSTNTPRQAGSINQGYESGLFTGNGCETQNNTGKGSLVKTNINQNNEINLSNNIAVESQKTQTHPNVDYNTDRDNNAVINNQNRGITDSIAYADFLKLLNSVGEMEQHSELDAPKVPNNVNFYEGEKKNIPVQVNERNSSITRHQNHLNSKESPNVVNENTVNLFKFLNDAQAKETTASSVNDSQNVFKFLRLAESRLPDTQVLLPSQVTPASTRGFSTVNSLKLLKITNNSGVTSSYSTNNKNVSSQLFTDKEINLFKFLNISEPNIGTKLNKINEGNIINSTLSDLNPVYKVLSEALTITGKINQAPPKAERTLRSDTLPGNQVEELAALGDGNLDNKGKMLNGDYVALASEEMLSKKVNLVNQNKIDKLKAGGSFKNGDSDCNPSVLTTCYVVECNVNSEKVISLETTPVVPQVARENTATVIYKTAEITTVSPSVTKCYVEDSNIKSEKGIPVETTTIAPQGARENTATVIYNTVEVITDSPSALTVSSVRNSPTCRTSIIYICNPETFTGGFGQESEMVQELVSTTTKPLAAMQRLPKKITLAPRVNCDSYIRSKQSLDAATTVSNVQQNQEEHFEEKAVYPLVESSLFLANNNEMPKANGVPILLNTSSDYMMDLILSDKDKLVNFHGNPSDLIVNKETVEDIPRKMGRAKNKRKKIVSIKNAALRENEQVVHPGQVVRMQFAGKNIIVEQMPSYRSEKFNKNCESTPSGEPSNDEMDPDGEENEVISRTKSSKKTKPAIEVKSTYEQTESSETYIQVTTQITSKKTDRMNKIKENESYTKSGSVSSTETLTKQYENTIQPYKMQDFTKGPLKIQTTVAQPKDSEETYSQITTQETSQGEKTNRSEKENPVYVTECKTVKIIKNTPSPKKQTASQDSKTESFNTLWGSVQNIVSTETATKSTTKKAAINIFGSEYVPQSSSVAPKMCGPDQVSAEETSVGMYSTKDQICSQNVFIPGESVKEIIIQIIRNTKKPSDRFNNKSCRNYKDDDSGENKIPNNNRYIQQTTVFTNEKIKPGGYEMEMSYVEKNNHQDLNYWYPELHKDEIEIGSIHKYDAYPYIGKMNDLLDNIDGMEKESTEDIIAAKDTWSKARFKEFKQDANKNKKVLPYSASKPLAEDNDFNSINGAY